MRIFNAMDLHIRTGWQLENIDKMVEQLSEDSLCIIDKNEATEIKHCNGKDCKNIYERYNIPTIENGYYYFKDRHSESTNKYDYTDINNRPSYNFTFAILDKDTNTIYYYELDT